jgi:Uma2 family endonuclease
MTQLLFNPEDINLDPATQQATAEATGIAIDVSHWVIEDDTPVDNFQSAQQQRLLVNALYSSEAVPKPFIAEANVGLFYQVKGDPIVPDVLLSLNVQRAEDWTEKRNRSYFVWELGKVPDVCIEIVSNKEGDEVGLSPKSKQKGKILTKKDIYARIGIPYYVVFDPLQQIQGETDLNQSLLRVWMVTGGRQVEITSESGITEVGQMVWLEGVELGLTLWFGQFEDEIDRLWLRWCDRTGQVIPTGMEGLQLERQRTEAEKARADRLAEKLRALGINPDEVDSPS